MNMLLKASRVSINSKIEQAYLSPVYLEENCNDDGNFKEKKAADGNNILKSKSRKEIICSRHKCY